MTNAMAVDRIRGINVLKIVSGVTAHTSNASAVGTNKPLWQRDTQSPVDNNSSNVDHKMLD